MIVARVLVVGLVVVAACARDEARRPVVPREAPVATSVATLEVRTAELRRRCSAHGRDAAACRHAEAAKYFAPRSVQHSGRAASDGHP